MIRDLVLGVLSLWSEVFFIGKGDGEIRDVVLKRFLQSDIKRLRVYRFDHTGGYGTV